MGRIRNTTRVQQEHVLAVANTPRTSRVEEYDLVTLQYVGSDRQVREQDGVLQCKCMRIWAQPFWIRS